MVQTKQFFPHTPTLELHTKQIVTCESTAKELSFEWSLHRSLSADSKVKMRYETISFSTGSRWVNSQHQCRLNKNKENFRFNQ